MSRLARSDRSPGWRPRAGLAFGGRWPAAPSPAGVPAPGPGRRRGVGAVGIVILCLCLCLWLGACQATVRVDVSTNRNGSGTVTVTGTLDRDAARAMPDLAQELRTADLQQAGWRIVGPSPAPGGGTTVSASKSFRSAAEANAILAELTGASGSAGANGSPGASGSGADGSAASTASGASAGSGGSAGSAGSAGAFNLRLSRHQGLISSSTSFTGTVDLSCGIECFADSQLQQQLGANLGLDPAKLQQAGINPGQLVGFQVGVHLPGTIQTSNAPSRAHGNPQWSLKLGERASLLATARALDVTRVVIIAVVAAALVVALVVGLLIWWRRRRRRGSDQPSARRQSKGRHRRWEPRHAAARR